MAKFRMSACVMVCLSMIDINELMIEIDISMVQMNKSVIKNNK